MAHDYLLIFSSGRSGSNWLLDILDLSDRTLARNEPYGAAPNAAFARLGSARAIIGSNDRLLEREWDRVVEVAARSVGPRDHMATAHKRYIRRGAVALKFDVLMRKHRMRRVVSALVPGIRGHEWRLPGWLVDRERLAEALAIFKINNAPGWGVWAMRNRPAARVLHLVRHPGGMLNSWSKRYVAQRDADEVLRVNRKRLRDVIATEGSWGEWFGDIDAMGLDETEMWYWRYSNESLYTEGRGRKRYRAIAYERLTTEPMAAARGAFAFCGLEWDDRVERGVQAMSGESKRIAKAWRSALTEEQVAMVERVLDGSPLAELWDEAGVATASR